MLIVEVADGEPTGVEVELVKGFAERVAADVEWAEGSEAEVFGALELGELDLVVGGLVSDNPFASHASFTHSYVTTFVRIGVPADQDVPATVEGLEVAVQRGTEIAGLVEEAGAVPVRVDDLSAVDGPAAVPEWLLDDLGLRDSGVTLQEADHVMAVPMGENAWQIRPEEFLLDNEDTVRELLDRLGRP
jgi:hypothetical protein